MASEHKSRKAKHESYGDMINMEMFTSEATPSHVMIGFGVGGIGLCVTKTNQRDVEFSGSSSK